jgi:hypothetical protein
MEAARWLVVFVALVTTVGGLLADYFIPWSGRQHIKIPPSPSCEVPQRPDYTNGLALGVLAVASLFGRQTLDMGGLLTAAILASLYCVCLLAAPIFAGTAWTDPEFKPITPRPMGLHPQQLIAFVLLAILLAAIG